MNSTLTRPERPTEENTRWSELLATALTVPGVMKEAYRSFYNYSVGNQILAWAQLQALESPLGPLATFKGWLDRGRCVRKGEKALVLCQPVTITKRDKVTDDVIGRFTRFNYRASWFTIHQTEPLPNWQGPEFEQKPSPEWSQEAALKAFDIELIPFQKLNGNVQGYATRQRKIAINPVASHPFSTMVHEIAHIVLEHFGKEEEGSFLTSIGISDLPTLELEAEATAMLVCDALGVDVLDSARSYIQAWFKGQTVPEKSANKIFAAANKILNAGKPKAETTEEE